MEPPSESNDEYAGLPALDADGGVGVCFHSLLMVFMRVSCL